MCTPCFVECILSLCEGIRTYYILYSLYTRCFNRERQHLWRLNDSNGTSRSSQPFKAFSLHPLIPHFARPKFITSSDPIRQEPIGNRVIFYWNIEARQKRRHDTTAYASGSGCRWRPGRILGAGKLRRPSMFLFEWAESYGRCFPSF